MSEEAQPSAAQQQEEAEAKEEKKDESKPADNDDDDDDGDDDYRAQAEAFKDAGNAAVKAAAIERAKAVAKQAVAEVAGSVRGKNGRAEADLSSSELYAAKRALISCLQGLPDDERLAKVDQHGVRGCEFEASMDW